MMNPFYYKISTNVPKLILTENQLFLCHSKNYSTKTGRKISNKKFQKQSIKAKVKLTSFQTSLGIQLDQHGRIPIGIISFNNQTVDLIATVLVCCYPKLEFRLAVLQVIQTIKFYNHCIINHGVKDGTKKYKEIFSYMIGLSRNANPEPLIRIAVSRNNKVPKKLSYSNVLVVASRSGDWKAHQCILTLYGIYKYSEVIQDLDTKSIQRSLTNEQNIFRDKICKRFSVWLEKQNINKLSTILEENRTLFLSGKKGPNQKKALLSADAEAIALRDNETVWPLFKEICNSLNRSDLVGFIEAIPKDRSVDGTKICAVMTVPDSGNKHRAVGLINFWYQQVFSTLNKGCKTILHQYIDRGNCYFHDHNSILAFCEKKAAETGYSLSLDLSNATDAIPAELQREVLKAIFSGNIAQKWFELIRRTNFSTKVGDVNYQVGQPMGSIESFSLFSLTLCLLWDFSHDELVEVGALENPIPKQQLFANVGDDNTGFNLLVTNKFIDILSGCGVEFNQSKQLGKIGDDQWIETCSRISVNSTNVTPISVKLIKLASADWKCYPELLQQMSDNGVDLNTMFESMKSMDHLNKVGLNGFTPLEVIAFHAKTLGLSCESIDITKFQESEIDVNSYKRALLGAKFMSSLLLILEGFKTFKFSSENKWQVAQLSLDLCDQMQRETFDPFSLNGQLADIAKYELEGSDDTLVPLTKDIVRAHALNNAGIGLYKFQTMEFTDFWDVIKKLNIIVNSINDSSVDIKKLIEANDVDPYKSQFKVTSLLNILNSIKSDEEYLHILTSGGVKISLSSINDFQNGSKIDISNFEISINNIPFVLEDELDNSSYKFASQVLTKLPLVIQE